jgi:hypothetical protein
MLPPRSGVQPVDLTVHPIGCCVDSPSTGVRAGSWWKLCLPVLTIALLVGCQGGPQSDVVERELRWQEDQIYALKSYLDEYHQELRRTRRENSKLKRELQAPPPAADELTPLVPEIELGPKEPVPVVPDVELGPQSDLRNRFQAPVRTSHHEFSMVQGASWKRPVTDAESAQVASVALRGQIHESQQGTSIVALVESRSSQGKPTELRGELSLMVLDEASETPSQPLARWDFTPEQIEEARAAGSNPAGVELDLPLAATLPDERPVQLWVRYVDEEGNKWLNSAELDPGRSFEFASAESQNSGLAKSPKIRIEPLPPTAHAAPISVDDAGWSVTWPGHASEVAQPAEWEPSSEPIPEVARVPSNPGGRYGSVASQRATWSPDRQRTASVRPSRTVRRRNEGSTAPPSWAPER